MQRLAKFASAEITDIRGRVRTFENQRVQAQNPVARIRRASKETLFVFFMGLCGAIVLLAGLALIWRFTPSSSSDPLAAQSSANYQNAYITWVANTYWQKKNLAQAQQQLSSWKMQDLASYMPLLIQETSDAETRRHLIALRDALKLPVPQVAYPPTQWSDDYKRLYIIYVASKYWLTGDKTTAQKSFADWNQDDLAKQLLALSRETTDSETRRNIVVLTEILHLPISQSSLVLFIMNQPGLVLACLLAATPLLAISGSITLPRARKMRRRILKRIGVLPANAPEEEEEERGVIGKSPEESLDEILAEAQSAEMATAAGTEQEQAKEEEKKEEEEEKEDAQSGGLGDLASLFEEEDTSINALEAFCKGMADVNIDELLALSQNIIMQMRTGVRKDQPSEQK